MKKFTYYFSVGIGCFFGGISRYFFENQFNSPQVIIPLGTFISNMLGTLIIGLALGLFLKKKIRGNLLKSIITTGFCGGLTTFSSFSFEVVKMSSTASWYITTGYVSLTILLGLLNILIGFYLVLGKKLTLYL